MRAIVSSDYGEGELKFDDCTELAEGHKEGRLVRTGRTTGSFYIWSTGCGGEPSGIRISVSRRPGG